MVKKIRLGGEIVYSTDPDFQPDISQEADMSSFPPTDQYLSVRIDKKHRRGKTVTLVKGFVGNESELKELGKVLKKSCGVGGSVKNGEIIIQGSFVDKIVKLLVETGYHVK
ncbi:MAG: translation initiation factor [Candidatus Marinimicrobia bacterium]|nr:translation initiation factor [Candidatus Neomarinimicrobiota bacterium]